MGTYTSVVMRTEASMEKGKAGCSLRRARGSRGSAQDRGKLGPGGTVSYRGILYFQTASQKLAGLNATPGVFEYEVDAEGKTHRPTPRFGSASKQPGC